MNSSKSEKIIESISKKIGKEELSYYKIHGELPALKLSKEELQAINGAGLWKALTGKTFKQWVDDKLPKDFF